VRNHFRFSFLLKFQAFLNPGEMHQSSPFQPEMITFFAGDYIFSGKCLLNQCNPFRFCFSVITIGVV